MSGAGLGWAGRAWCGATRPGATRCGCSATLGAHWRAPPCHTCWPKQPPHAAPRVLPARLQDDCSEWLVVDAGSVVAHIFLQGYRQVGNKTQQSWMEQGSPLAQRRGLGRSASRTPDFELPTRSHPPTYPPTHHPSCTHPPTHHPSCTHPPTHHPSCTRPPTHHSSCTRPPTHSGVCAGGAVGAAGRRQHPAPGAAQDGAHPGQHPMSV